MICEIIPISRHAINLVEELTNRDVCSRLREINPDLNIERRPDRIDLIGLVG